MFLNFDMLFILAVRVSFDISSVRFKDMKRNPKYRTAMLWVKMRMDGEADLFGGEARILENEIQGRKIR
jgi:hypothetical protein